MHASFFGIKRVHLRVLAVTRPMIAESKLTPARFDMMRIVRLYGDEGIPQGTVQWLLGVSAPTVSRMLKSLEQLGLVERDRDARDGRCKKVYLTKRGRDAVDLALRMTVDNDEAEHTAARGVLGSTRVETEFDEETWLTIDLGREHLDVLDSLTAKMRKAFRDRAPFRHPWRRGPFVDFDGSLLAELCA
jgi:DNA-binding MarR family transcriptional regulator